MAGRDKDEVNQELLEKSAEQLFAVLGELKGGAMKVGQAMSIMEAAIPDEFGEPFREALTKLQAEAPPLSASKVHRVLDQQLGTKWRSRFREFSDEPAAAASIGQVHRAVWSDGRDVAVKIQYPGADHALKADLKTLSRMSGLMQKLSPGTDVKSMMDELIDRTEAELDYLGEADNQRAFAKAFDGDPDFVVPKVVASSPKVIVSEWLNGTPLSKIITNGDKATRDRAAALMSTFEVSSPFRVGLLHGDPHPRQLLPHRRRSVRRTGFRRGRPLPERVAAGDRPDPASRAREGIRRTQGTHGGGGIHPALPGRQGLTDRPAGVSASVRGSAVLRVVPFHPKVVAARRRSRDRRTRRGVQDLTAPQRPQALCDGVPRARRMRRHRRTARRRGAIPGDHGEVGAGPGLRPKRAGVVPSSRENATM